MEFLKSRKTAAALLAVVIIIFTPLGARLSLQRAANNVEDMFYDGVYVKDEGYTSGAIETYLESRIKSSLNLITVGSNYDSLSTETAALRTARENLLSAGTIGEKYSANSELETAWNALYTALQSAGMSDQDSANCEEYVSELSGAQGAIQMNKYNESVSEFEQDVLGRFPAGIIADVFSVDTPDSFGGN